MYFVDKLLASLLFGQCISLLGYNNVTQICLKIGVLRLLHVRAPFTGELFSSGFDNIAIIQIFNRGIVFAWM